MENDSKVALGLAVAGICIGGAGLAFGWLAYTQGEELEADLGEMHVDLGEMHGLLEKVREIEEGSSNLSATAERLTEDIDTLRATTQEALNSASSELSRLRRDLNSNVQAIRALENEIEDIDDWIAHVEALPSAITSATNESPPDTAEADASGARSTEPASAAEPAEAENSPDNDRNDAFTVHIVQAGDTLSAIANQHGVSLDAVLRANDNVDPARMQIGQEIRVPAR